MLVLAPAASAHLKLRSFEPADSAPLAQAPDEVKIEFTAEVGDALEEVTVTAPDGDDVPVDPTVDGRIVTIDLPARMGDGTWTVDWAVVGADGHPVRSSRTFSINAPSAPERAAYPVEKLETIALVGRVVFFLALLLFVGGGIFALHAAPGFMPSAWGAMALNVVGGALAIIGTHAAIVERASLLGMLDPRIWLEAAWSSGGRGYALAAIAVLLALRIGRTELTPPRWSERQGDVPWLVASLLLVAAAGPMLSSHALSGDGVLVRGPLDVLHVLAAGAWIGGLVQLLALTIERRAGNPGIPLAVERYSRIAFVSVATLVLTGAVATWIELDGSFGDLTGTMYGRLLLFKIALLLATIPLARVNQTHNVPDLRRIGPTSLARLRRYVAWEFAIVVWVVVATSVLVAETPPGEDMGGHQGHGAAAASDR